MIINETISGVIVCRSQEIRLDENNVISASCKRQACRDGAFEIGGVYAASLNLVCRLPGMGLFDVRGAEIILYSQYDSEENPHCIGTFWAVNVRKTGDIFTIDGQDAVGWLDTSSYNDKFSKMSTYLAAFEQNYRNSHDDDRPTVMEWFAELTACCNSFIRMQTGISNLLKWQNYNSSVNAYFGNEHLWRNDGDGWHPKSMFRPSLYTDNGGADSDCPRDFFSYLAEITGGFIYADPETGSLTLGQFGMISPGKARISTNQTELDSFEVADYTIELRSVYVYGEIKAGTWADGSISVNPTYQNKVWTFWNLDANPFVDGFAAAYVIDSATQDIMTSVADGLWNARYHTDSYSGIDPTADERREAAKFQVRPFQCRVHAGKRFALGQQITLNYQDIADSSAVYVYQSIITSIQWTFRGGHVIACGGEDSRVMADCLRASKADKAVREARNRCAAIETKLRS